MTNSDTSATRSPLPSSVPTVGDFMSWPPLTVTPDLTLDTVRHMLLDNAVGALPVVNDRGHVVGVLSRTDVLLVTEEGPEFEDLIEGVDVSQRLGYESRIVRLGATVSDIMTRNVLTVPQDATLSSAARTMAASRVHHLVVLDPGGTVSGVLSCLDIVEWLGNATRS